MRWHAAKADVAAQLGRVDHLGEEPAISRLLVVRRTRATRAVATEFARQLRVAYPAHPDDAARRPRPAPPVAGAALVWITLERSARERLVGGR